MVLDRDHYDPGYSISGCPISRVSTTRDLGVIIQDELKTFHHTTKARSSGLKTLWMLRRSFSSWSSDMFRKLHTSIIRPAMEYGAPAYHPCTRKEVAALEYVQRLGSRMVPELRHLSYPDRCRSLNLFTLEYRRTRADLLFLYRLVVQNAYPDLRHLVQLVGPGVTRGHPFKLQIHRSDALPHIFRLSRRAIPLWNYLPSAVVSSPSFDQFKVRLDTYLCSLNTEDLLRPGHLYFSPFGLRLTPP